MTRRRRALFFLFTVDLINTFVVSQPSSPGERLKTCFNTQQHSNGGAKLDVSLGASFADFLAERDTRLQVELVLWSAKRPSMTDLRAAGDLVSKQSSRLRGVSMVNPRSSSSSSASSGGASGGGWPLGFFTAASMSRLAALQAQCRSWPGPLAVALYVPLLTTNISEFERGPQPEGGSSRDGTGGSSKSKQHHSKKDRKQRSLSGSAGAPRKQLSDKKRHAQDAREDLVGSAQPAGMSIPASLWYWWRTAVDTMYGTHRKGMEEPSQHKGSKQRGSGPNPASAPTGPNPLRQLPSVPEALEAAHRLFDAMEAVPGACALRLVVVSERVADLAMAALFPVAAVRNLALLALDTPLAAMVDADLLVGQAVADELASLSPRARTLMAVTGAPAQRLIVLPTFEPPKLGKNFTSKLPGLAALARGAAVSSKLAVSELLHSEQLLLFDTESNPEGHGPTDLNRWLTAEEAFEVVYQERFEPWYIADRTALQPYDERYRGYGRQKLSQVAHQVSTGSSFLVHPGGFLIHQPHEKSAGANVFQVGKNASLANTHTYRNQMGKGALQLVRGQSNAEVAQQQVQKISRVYDEAVAAMNAGTYVPLVNAAAVRCRQQLPWWSGKPAHAIWRSREAKNEHRGSTETSKQRRA